MKKRIDTATRIEEQVREKYAEIKGNDPEALVLFKGRVDYRCYGADVPRVWAAVEKGLKGMGTLYENKEDEFPLCDMAAFQDRYLDKVLPLLVGAGHSVAMVQLEY
ncbi:MAG: hypothetical protein LUI09_01750 [Prevotellaceae bacterium]|nr:hypothetical protein [Prevotellaceae bacterium]